MTDPITIYEKMLILILEKIGCMRDKILYESEINEYLTIIRDEIEDWTKREFRIYMKNKKNKTIRN